VTLDRTVAFAASGGQASDAGTIAGHEILEARCDGLEIRYRLVEDHGLAAGDPVVVAIDADRRRRLVRLHFAAELVLELMTQLHPAAEKVGADIRPDKARIDFVWETNITELLPQLAAEIERIVAEDYVVMSDFSDEATQRRYWRIDGFAQVPCGGTHPRRTGEVGAVLLRRTNPGRGKERIEILLAD
jgi:Ser-tRNA(Ala) deacylase AlaX